MKYENRQMVKHYLNIHSTARKPLTSPYIYVKIKMSNHKIFLRIVLHDNMCMV